MWVPARSRNSRCQYTLDERAHRHRRWEGRVIPDAGRVPLRASPPSPQMLRCPSISRVDPHRAVDAHVSCVSLRSQLGWCRCWCFEPPPPRALRRVCGRYLRAGSELICAQSLKMSLCFLLLSFLLHFFFPSLVTCTFSFSVSVFCVSLQYIFSFFFFFSLPLPFPSLYCNSSSTFIPFNPDTSRSDAPLQPPPPGPVTSLNKP